MEVGVYIGCCWLYYLYSILVSALQTLKNALSLPLRLGWNGDPCVPQEHPWSGADCHFDSNSSKWFIDGLYFLDPWLIFILFHFLNILRVMIASYVMSYLLFIFYLFELKSTSPQLSKLYTVTEMMQQLPYVL